MKYFLGLATVGVLSGALLGCKASDREFGAGAGGAAPDHEAGTSGGGGNTGGGSAQTGGASSGGANTGGDAGTGGVAPSAGGRPAEAGVCPEGKSDCDDTVEGCETDLGSVLSCGTSCDAREECVSTNALGSACTGGKCVLTCEPGFANCDGKGSTGCETNLNDFISCGTSCETMTGCLASKPVCATGTCVERPSCQGLPKTCGLSRNADCCVSYGVGGGTYSRGVINPGTATVSDFRLDVFEITVARFRKFVAAWMAGYRPKAGDGKHVHLNGGKGLNALGGGYESGWNPSWAANMGSTAAEWDANLTCEPFPEWTAGNDDLPMGCTNWWEMVAFCIWDGGFLPSEAEWEWAASGREADRLYPWGNDPPIRPPMGTNPTRAAYDCLYDSKGSPTQVCSTDSIARPGELSAGMSVGGHHDMAGNVGEWVMDYHGPYPPTCVDCVQRTFNTSTIARGGQFAGPVDYLATTHRGAIETESRYASHGARCARRL